MKSTILISRITRAIETEGEVGEGASLAEEYSAAVRRVNTRLESVQASIDAKQVSDAVRMMEDEPRLLDEVGALDFPQLSDWVALCSRKNWELPLKLDRATLERVLLLTESSEAVESFLRMYRKAVRTNNNRMAVQSLRRLVQIDHSQNWMVNLIQAEEAIQKQLVADFRAAKASGNVDEVDRLAQELVELNWTEPPALKGIDEIRSYIVEKEARLRIAEGAEDLAIIRRCLDESWNRSLAFSMVQAIDGLVDKGLTLMASDREAVESCRRRCADEMEAEEKDCRWKALCEQLYAAIQQENTSTIRDVLSAPEFLNREPDPELIKQAQLVIQHEEMARRRKMLQIAVCAMAGLLGILGVSGWWLKQKLFNDRCEGEAVKLAALEKGEHAVDRLAEALRRLQDEAPDVYADPRVNVFDGKLKTLRSQMDVRTNEIASVLSELTTLKDANWGDNTDAVTSRIERINAIITKDDDAFRADFLAIKSSWSDHCDEVAAANRNAATNLYETLTAHVKVVERRLKGELMSEELAKELAACKASLDDWKRVHAQHAPALEGAIGEVEKSLGEAENMQQNLQAAIKKLKESKTATEYLYARKSLVEFYSAYPCVKTIGEHPVTAEDATAVVDGFSQEQKTYENLLKVGVGDESFKAFIADNVISLAEVPSYYSLYGVVMTGSQYYFAVSKGRPKIKDPGSDGSFQVDGELLDFRKGEMVKQISRKDKYGKPLCEPLPSSEEIKEVVDLASQSGISLTKFESGLLKIIARHLNEAEKSDFMKKETDVSGKEYLSVGRYPAIRRVQLLRLYVAWLRDDLRVVPRDDDLSRWFTRIEDLAQPVRVDNIPDDLTWACIRENRICQRNAECARLLSQMAKHKLIGEYRSLRNAHNELRRLTGWKIEYAGCNAFDPYDSRWKKDHSVVLPSVLENVVKDHPLYVLRRESGRLVLKRALLPYKNGTVWAIASGMSKQFVPGDPLFHISDHGKYIDAEDTIGAILKTMPESVAKHFAAKIPLFNVEVK